MSFPVHPSYGPNGGQVFTQQPYPNQQPIIIYQQQPGYQQQRQDSNCCDCCACCQCCLMCCACTYLLTCCAELCCSVFD